MLFALELQCVSVFGLLLNVQHLSDIQYESGEGVDKLPKDVGSDCFTHAPDLNNLIVVW